MARIAAAAGAIVSHTPKPAKIRRLALPSAVLRSSKLVWAAESKAVLSTSNTRTPVPARPSARLAPTMPPPMTATSVSWGAGAVLVSAMRACDGARASAARHQCLDFFHCLWRARAQDFRRAPGHDHVVLYADADVTEALRDAAGRSRQVDARLDGE